MVCVCWGGCWPGCHDRSLMLMGCRFVLIFLHKRRTNRFFYWLWTSLLWASLSFVSLLLLLLFCTKNPILPDGGLEEEKTNSNCAHSQTIITVSSISHSGLRRSWDGWVGAGRLCQDLSSSCLGFDGWVFFIQPPSPTHQSVRPVIT